MIRVSGMCTLHWNSSAWVGRSRGSTAHVEVHPQQNSVAVVSGLDQALRRVLAVVYATRDDDSGQHEDKRVGDKLQLLPAPSRGSLMTRLLQVFRICRLAQS